MGLGGLREGPWETVGECSDPPLGPAPGAMGRVASQTEEGLGEGDTPGLNLDLLGQKVDCGQLSLYFSFLICEMG